MLTQIEDEIIPQSPKISSFIKLIDQAVFPEQLVNFSHISNPKTVNPNNTETVQKMTNTQEVIEISTNLEDIETAKLFRKHNLTADCFQDEDYKFELIIASDDLNVFD